MYHNIIDFQLQCETTHYLCNAPPPFPEEGLVPEKLEGDVQPASQIPYPSYDQNLRYSLPYVWPDQTFETLFFFWLINQNPVSDQHYNKFPTYLFTSDQYKITVNIVCKGHLLIFFSIMMAS